MDCQQAEIKRGMLVRGRRHPVLGIATTDEYEDDEKWQAQDEFWRGQGYQLNGRHTMVDVIHIRVKAGVVKSGKKTYIYPRERLKILAAETMDRLLSASAVSNA
ncbi:hypothetical protein ES703_20004 [subsurface metagenome]